MMDKQGGLFLKATSCSWIAKGATEERVGMAKTASREDKERGDAMPPNIAMPRMVMRELAAESKWSLLNLCHRTIK
jgi:hypothetical protein